MYWKIYCEDKFQCYISENNIINHKRIFIAHKEIQFMKNFN